MIKTVSVQLHVRRKVLCQLAISWMGSICILSTFNGLKSRSRSTARSIHSCKNWWDFKCYIFLLLLFVQACFATLLASCHAGLLGAGTGEGSCPAAPFRADPSALKYTVCPQHASCCTEFGYCHPKTQWDLGNFRSAFLAFGQSLLLLRCPWYWKMETIFVQGL